MNRYEGIGRLVADPDMRHANSGTTIANFKVACDDGYGEKKTTYFCRCVAFGKQAELIGEKCGKGSRIFISGAMQQRKWQDRDGNDRYSEECIIRTFEFLDGKKTAETTRSSGYPEMTPGDDVPF